MMILTRSLDYLHYDSIKCLLCNFTNICIPKKVATVIISLTVQLYCKGLCSKT